MSDSRWQKYLFERSSKTWLASWVPTLRYFRFCRAYGGHANDGDELLVAIRIDSKLELEASFTQLGIPIVHLPLDNPTPLPGVKYNLEDFKKFRSPIREYPTLEQPGHIKLGNARAFAWVHPGRLELAISDSADQYEVTQAAIEAARSAEALIEPISSLVIDPPRDNQHCICPKYYPEFWPYPA